MHTAWSERYFWLGGEKGRVAEGWGKVEEVALAKVRFRRIWMLAWCRYDMACMTIQGKQAKAHQTVLPAGGWRDRDVRSAEPRRGDLKRTG